jgi:hypothetical protein
LEVISYNYVDPPSVQSTMKYTYHGQVLDHDFLDAEQPDFVKWKITGSSWYGQCALVDREGIVVWMDDYAIDFNGLTDAIEEIIYGGIPVEPTSLGHIKAGFTE